MVPPLPSPPPSPRVRRGTVGAGRLGWGVLTCANSDTIFSKTSTASDKCFLSGKTLNIILHIWRLYQADSQKMINRNGVRFIV